MELPIISIVVTIIIVALLWWVLTQFVTDPMILKVARVVLVVIVCLWLLGLLTGRGPMLTFR
jgi:uncharacterized membrane protein YwzB